jgi:gliding motility-associated protein GldM
MSLPKEPRQKMINIMYLVLTALLALNVSSEILNAFKTVNKSLENTNKTVNHSTEQIMNSLQEKLSDPTSAAKAQQWYPVAQKVQGYTKSVYDYIQGLKADIIKEAGGDINDSTKSYKEDNLDIATRMMVTKKKGQELLQKLQEFQANVLSADTSGAIGAQFKGRLPINLEKPNGISKAAKTWEGAYFHMVPTVAALTILSKFQNDVKVTENTVIQEVHNKVGEVKVRYDKFAAIVGQNSSYLMPGQDLEVTAGVGAFSTASLPSISINGGNVPVDADGVATQKITTGGIGEHTVSVHITYKDQDGKEQTVDKDVKYTVGQSNASIALDKMNVLYIGVDNPVSIAASGGGDDKTVASITGGGGSLTKTGSGKYIARVSQQTDDCKISVNVDGKLAGQSVFRVRGIPEAQAYVGGHPSGDNINASEFKAQPGVAAGIKNFPFQLEYSVVSFTFTCDTDDDIAVVPVTGNSFQAVGKAMSNVQAGRMVTIDNIKVKGPDGHINKAPSLVYYIK